MEARDIRNLQEAYMEVYLSEERNPSHPHWETNRQFKKSEKRNQELIDARAERQKDRARNKNQIFIGKAGKITKTQKEETDLYDLILSHLLDEGYADTQEKAEVLMVNMSEDWREDILDEAKKKVKIHTDKPIEYKIADIGPGKKEYNVKKSKGWVDSVKEEKKTYEPDPFGRPGGKYGGVPKKGSSYDKAIEANKKAIEALDRKKANEEVDLYDTILTYLLDEGYAETQEQAEVIMVNMSEDWRDDILSEVYDADVMGRSQIRKTGEGGRVGAERKKSGPERRRVKAVGGGKTEPVDYKPRSDIGSQRQTSTRVQQPTQERGSADVRARAAAAAKEERRKAALARAAAAKGDTPDTQTKAKPKEISKQATQLLSKKAEKKSVSPDYTPPKASGHTAAERMSITRAGETELKNIMKTQEIQKYKDITGENPKGKALTKVLARVHKRMST